MRFADYDFSEFREYTRSGEFYSGNVLMKPFLACWIWSATNCPKFAEAYKIVLEKMKPDVTFVITRYVPKLTSILVISCRDDDFFAPINGSVDKDPLFQHAQRKLDFIR